MCTSCMLLPLNVWMCDLCVMSAYFMCVVRIMCHMWLFWSTVHDCPDDCPATLNYYGICTRPFLAPQVCTGDPFWEYFKDLRTLQGVLSQFFSCAYIYIAFVILFTRIYWSIGHILRLGISILHSFSRCDQSISIFWVKAVIKP